MRKINSLINNRIEPNPTMFSVTPKTVKTQSDYGILLTERVIKAILHRIGEKRIIVHWVKFLFQLKSATNQNYQHFMLTSKKRFDSISQKKILYIRLTQMFTTLGRGTNQVHLNFIHLLSLFLIIRNKNIFHVQQCRIYNIHTL